MPCARPRPPTRHPWLEPRTLGPVTAGSVRSSVKVGLVGRERELAELRGALDDAAGGHGQVWLVGGEAGMGKTRLLEAVAEVAGPTEVRVLWGRCWEGGGAPAYWPWAQVLRGAIADVGADALAARLGPGADDVASLVPEVAARLPGVAPAQISEAPGGRFRLFESVAAFLVRTGAEAPLLVALDDLHAADEASVLLLEFVAAEAPRAAVAVIGAYREDEVAASPRLTQLLAGVARHGQRLDLAGLDRAGVETLFQAATDAPARPEVVARVHEVTEGNPFLVKEVARLVAGRRRLGPGDRLPLPEEAHAIVGRRLAPLSEPLRGVLGAAAVLGRDFDVTSLAALTAEAPADLLDALGEARRQGVIEEAGAGRWSFSHALLREVLLDELTPSARAELHRRAADTCEARAGPDIGARLAAVAHHRYEAASTGEDTDAADACAVAGARAMATLAFEDAAGWYERALEVLPLSSRNSDRRRYDLLMALGHARFRASQFDEAWDAHNHALELARSLGSAELLAQAALESSVIRRPDRDLVALLEEALAGLADGDSALRARLLGSLSAGLLMTSPEGWRRSKAMGDEGLAMARRVGDPDALLTVLLRWHRSQWEWDPVGVEERLKVADEALRLSEDAGRAGEWARSIIRCWRFCDLLDLGEIAAARAEADDASSEAQHLRLPACTSVATFMQAALALLRSDLDVALEFVRRGYTALEDFDFRLQAYTVAIHRQKGELAEVRQTLMEVIRPPAAGAFGPYWHLSFRADAALSAVELGDESARLDFEALLSDAISLPGPPLDPDVLVRLAQGCWFLGAADHAEELYELLLPYRGRLVNYQIMAAPLGAADRHLAQLATLLGRYDDAEDHFEAAHSLHRRWGAPGFLAHGQADHARMLSVRNGPGDRARASELAAKAAASYRALGMVYYEEQASKLAAATAGSVPDGPPPTRERHILREEGEYWCFGYGGREVRLRDSKGVRYLIRLLQAPGRELHVLDVTGARFLGGALGMEGDAGTVLDPATKAAYRRRLAELEAEAGDADDAHDLARAEQARVERDFLVDELAAAVGLGGRDRVAASTTERARQSVSKGVRSAIGRLGRANPALGRHLEATVHTGTYCSYRPDPRAPITWGEE